MEILVGEVHQLAVDPCEDGTAAAFFAGSIPFALLIGFARGVDIRKHGSGNVGASNAGRVLGKPWGMLCFVLDAGKGAAPVIAAGLTLGWFGGDSVTFGAASAPLSELSGIYRNAFADTLHYSD